MHLVWFGWLQWLAKGSKLLLPNCTKDRLQREFHKAFILLFNPNEKNLFYEATLWLEAFSLTSTTAVILLDMSLVLISWRKKKAQQVVESLPGMVLVVWHPHGYITYLHQLWKICFPFFALHDFENCSQTFFSRRLEESFSKDLYVM